MDEADCGTDGLLADSSFAVDETRGCIMAGWGRAVELAMSDEELATLAALSRSRTEPASRVSRAQILLAYRENPSFCPVGQRLGVHHQTVQRCVERALADGAAGGPPGHRNDGAGFAAPAWRPRHLCTRP